MSREYTIIITVMGVEGEENMSISTISDLDMELIYPILCSIKENNGRYPTGTFIRPGQPSGRDLYRDFVGWEILNSMLPRPISGFSNILTFSMYKEEPWRMDLV